MLQNNKHTIGCLISSTYYILIFALLTSSLMVKGVKGVAKPWCILHYYCEQAGEVEDVMPPMVSAVNTMVGTIIMLLIGKTSQLLKPMLIRNNTLSLAGRKFRLFFDTWAVKNIKNTRQGSGSGSKSAWTSINFRCWIRIRIRIQV